MRRLNFGKRNHVNMKPKTFLFSVTPFNQLAYQYNNRALSFQIDEIKLYHYAPVTKKRRSRAPLLIVFAWINRPEILDLYPEQSFIRGLLNQGIDVYLLDWGDTPACQKQTIPDLIAALDHCSVWIKRDAKTSNLNLLGICQGGIISLCYTALTKFINQLILLSTPIHCHTRSDILAKLLRKLDLKILPKQVPGFLMTQFFMSLRPFELIRQKQFQLSDNLRDQARCKKFLLLEKWLHDVPVLSGDLLKMFIQYFYQHNALRKNRLVIGNQVLSLNQLNIPILNIMASKDRLIPNHASQHLKQIMNPNFYQERLYPTGHIGLYLKQDIVKKLTHDIAEWLSEP